ncbi:MAG: prepilin-type N-terminal cleavage/methylation domain-containing protein [Candidatus Riflebacteria bacterium]|nr:prepilin-type N-terminal cleavage/methylation domain-containing protein [Candidatus Riflebacteria bacterium]
MKKQGFTIIELLIVIAIISILVGVAVPYYNDYITDARLSVLKQNIATFRNSVNQFRGDNLRGPFAVPVNLSGSTILTDPLSGSTTGSELIAGPIQIIDNEAKRRPNIKYLPSMPVFADPFSGGNITPPNFATASPSAYFYDRVNIGSFDFDPDNIAATNDSEFAFIDGNNDQMYNSNTDTILFFDSTASYPGGVLPGGVATALDYTHVTLIDSTGNSY